MTDVPKDAREVYKNAAGETVAWCPKEGLGVTDLLRAEFFNANRERLIQMEKRAEELTQKSLAYVISRLRGMVGTKFCVVCIDVDDPCWTSFVDALMPGHDWAAYRARGETPVARGVVPRDVVTELVKEAYPAAGDAPEGVFTAVFAAGGVMYIVARET
jgi:hypothetical protein